jgi:hypothetical protein
MSKAVERKCPACGEVKLFRADCNTCGCTRRKKCKVEVPANAGAEGLAVEDVLERLAKSETKLQKARLELQSRTQAE